MGWPYGGGDPSTRTAGCEDLNGGRAAGCSVGAIADQTGHVLERHDRQDREGRRRCAIVEMTVVERTGHLHRASLALACITICRPRCASGA